MFFGFFFFFHTSFLLVPCISFSAVPFSHIINKKTCKSLLTTPNSIYSQAHMFNL